MVWYWVGLASVDNWLVVNCYFPYRYYVTCNVDYNTNFTVQYSSTMQIMMGELHWSYSTVQYWTNTANDRETSFKILSVRFQHHSPPSNIEPSQSADANWQRQTGMDHSNSWLISNLCLTSKLIDEYSIHSIRLIDSMIDLIEKFIHSSFEIIRWWLDA